MGGTSSKSTSETLTTLSTNVAMDTVSSCITAATQSQLISLRDISGDVTISNTTLTQGTSMNIACVMESTKQNEIAAAISEAIASYAESKGESVLSALGSTRSEVSTKIKNEIINNISATTTQELETNMSQTQSITAQNIDGNVVISNLTMEQSAKLTLTSLLKTSVYSSVINSTATAIDQSSKTTEKSTLANIIDSIGSAWKGILSSPVLIALVVAVVLALGAGVYILVTKPEVVENIANAARTVKR